MAPQVPVRTGFTLVAGAAIRRARSLAPKKKSSKVVIGIAALAVVALWGCCFDFWVSPRLAFADKIEEVFEACGTSGSETACRQVVGGSAKAAHSVRSGIAEHGGVESIEYDSYCVVHGFGVPDEGVIVARIEFGSGHVGVSEFRFVERDGDWVVASASGEPKGCEL